MPNLGGQIRPIWEASQVCIAECTEKGRKTRKYTSCTHSYNIVGQRPGCRSQKTRPILLYISVQNAHKCAHKCAQMHTQMCANVSK